MPKYFLISFILSILFACKDGEIKNSDQTETRKRRIDPILEEIIRLHPNYQNNQLVRENANKVLERKIDSVLNLGVLTDIPLKVFRIGKNPRGKGALVQFYSDNYNHKKPEVLSDRLNFDLIGFMDENLATELKDKETYHVFSKKLKRLNKAEISLLVNQVYYPPEVRISKNEIWDIYNFNIGDILCEIDSVKSIK